MTKKAMVQELKAYGLVDEANAKRLMRDSKEGVQWVYENAMANYKKSHQ